MSAVAAVPRNRPCPCGSGRKHKLCCGTTRSEERAERERARRREEGLEEIFDLPALFPRLRPAGAAFSEWADRVSAGELDEATVDDGIALLDASERARIDRSHGEEFPAVWESLSEEVGDEASASRVLLVGAVAAAIRERKSPDPRMLELIEEAESVRREPSELLAVTLDAGDLWSVHESIEAEKAVAELPEELDEDAYEVRWNATLTAESERLAGDWHRERLAVLVHRLRRSLPFAGYPAASRALAAACDAFERDEVLRARLAALLLADSVSWTYAGFLAD